MCVVVGRVCLKMTPLAFHNFFLHFHMQHLNFNEVIEVRVFPGEEGNECDMNHLRKHLGMLICVLL